MNNNKKNNGSSRKQEPQPKQRVRAPRAVKLDRGAYGDDMARPEPDTGATLSMAPEIDESAPDLDNIEQQIYHPAKKRGWTLATFFWSALSSLVMLALGLWLDQLVRELYARWEYLGWFGLGLVGIAGLALFIFLAREFLAIRRLSHLGNMREKVTELYEEGDRKGAMRLANELLALYQKQPNLFRVRQELKQDLPHLFDAKDILAQSEKILMPPIDQAASHRVHQAAKRVTVVTALSPRALFDIIVVLIETVRMARSIAELYGNRPGFVAMLRLSGHIAGHLAVTGGMAAGETLMQQVIGHGLAARLSAKLGEGLLNGILTARVGLATIAICRPMPFVTENQPSLGAVIKALRDQSESMEEEEEAKASSK